LLDGINPCAFAVLLFLIGIIFTLQRTRGDVFRVGGVYILAIFLIYFLIGLGLFKAIIFAGRFQVVAMIGAYLVIGLGLVNLKDFFFPKLPFKLRIPESKKGTIARWGHKATLPSAAVLGVLVAFYEFPCTGAIYVAVMGLLATKVTFFQGVGFLLLYNLMFVSPLIAILAASSNEYITKKFDKWRERRAGALRLLSGVVMISLGVIILVWFV
jgi:cytochrome c biogenesis protein CcdA